MKPDALIWFEVRDKSGQEVIQYQKAIIKEVYDNEKKILI